MDDLENILCILRKNTKISDAVLFGSRATGKYDPGSDIDIALTGEGLKLNDILDISTELDDLDLPWSVDLVIFDRIESPELIDHIERRGIRLMSSIANS